MKQIIAYFGLLLMLCGCSSQSDLAGKDFEWQNNDVKIALGFAENEPRFYGAVVNRYFGNYKTDGARIEFSPAGATMMMGPEPAMKAEQEWLQTLPSIVEYELIGNVLLLKSTNGEKFKLKQIKAEE